MFNQCLTMFIYMMTGFILYKTRIIEEKGSMNISRLLVWLVIPAMVIKSFCIEKNSSSTVLVIEGFALGALALIISMFIAHLLFHKNSLDDFGTAFSNAGFIGIPLVEASLGSRAVIGLIGFMSMLNILQWTYGVSLMTGKKVHMSLKEILLTPIIVSPIIGLLIYFSALGNILPSVIKNTVNGIASLNAPLAMIVLGTYLAKCNIRKMFTNPHLYLVSAVRLIVIPLITIFIFKFIPFSALSKMAVIIGASAPAGANCAVYAQLLNKDYPYGCQVVALSTVLSIITVPLICAFINLII